MLLIMGVNLYMSRLVLEILGVEDYGLYNVIGGMVVLFSLLSSSLSSSVTRFLSFELGRNRADRLETIFQYPYLFMWYWRFLYSYWLRLWAYGLWIIILTYLNLGGMRLLGTSIFSLDFCGEFGERALQCGNNRP